MTLADLELAVGTAVDTVNKIKNDPPEGLRVTRELALVSTKLDEAWMWLQAFRKGSAK